MAGVPSISVIVPFRGVRRYLAQCIESLLHQTLPHETYELLFIDNNSTDGGAAAVAAYPEVRLLSETKPGAYAARNRGLAEAKGQIIAFTDPDCVVQTDWLERIEAAMRAPGVGILLGHRSAATNHDLLKLVMAYESQKAAYVTRRGLRELCFGYTNNMAVRRDLIERVGPFPEVERGGDTVLVRRATEVYGCTIVRYCPEVRVQHLEVATLRNYYRKHRTYGESNELLSRLIQFRPLATRERWQVFRGTLREQGCSPLHGALLFVLLIPGMLCYDWGRYVVSVRRRFGGSSAGDRAIERSTASANPGRRHVRHQ